MRPHKKTRPGKYLVAALLLTSLLSGCASLLSSATSDLAANLSSAMLNHDDLDTVRDAAPAYLLMIDGMLRDDPDNVSLLMASARLYNSYAGVFVQGDKARSKRLSSRALTRALRAACLHHPASCQIRNQPFADFKRTVNGFTAEDVEVMYILGSSWAGWIQANSDDWNAIADLPRITAIMQRLVELDEAHEHGNAHLYLGISFSLLPPAAGGKPKLAKQHFERAIALSGGRNLMAKVLYAKHYARMVFDRDLHDRLLKEVLAADPVAPDLTLTNMLAQRQAAKLLASSNDYF